MFLPAKEWPKCEFGVDGIDSLVFASWARELHNGHEKFHLNKKSGYRRGNDELVMLACCTLTRSTTA